MVNIQERDEFVPFDPELVARVGGVGGVRPKAGKGRKT